MIPLSTRGTAVAITRPTIGRVSLRGVESPDRKDTVLAAQRAPAARAMDGYLAVLTPDESLSGVPGVAGCQIGHLEDGDIVSISPRGYVQTVFRASSRSNSLFATERCNSFCLMCSQPPRDVDDSGRVEELLRIVSLIDKQPAELGITGGEPTLLGDGLMEVVGACRDKLPSTAIHILSNGRRFYYSSFARKLAAVKHPNLMVGVPVYSDIGELHDYVVQARDSFAETILGLHNLGRFDVPVEIRVVVHKQTFLRLPQLAEYIYRNLTFAAHVAFMGLEMIGFAKANVADLWMDPLDYMDQLEEAVLLLATSGMAVSVYNQQLCTAPRSLWPFCRQSISDWKNEYAPECNGCAVRSDCGGFFVWNISGYRSRGTRTVALTNS